MLTQQPEGQQEYGTAKGWRIFMYVLGVPLILVFLAMPFLFYEKGETGLVVGVSVVALALAAFFGFCVLETSRAKHIITADKLIYAGALRRKELPLANIKGYRKDEQYTHLIPNNAHDPKIRIGYLSENYADIQAWFAARYPDLDSEDQQANAARLLRDETLGQTPAEREAQLSQARQMATALNVAGSVAGAWLFLEPRPYTWAILAGMLVPLLATSALWLYPGALRPDEKKNSADASVALAILLPTLLLLVRVVLDFEILDYSLLWPQAATVAGGLAVALLAASRHIILRKDSPISLCFLVLVYAALYGFAAISAYNCVFDHGPTSKYAVRVLSKHSSSGRATTYYLQVDPWGPRPAAADVAVSEEYYGQVKPGDTVRIYSRPGSLGIPWFTVAEQ
jgi:hypothetical protein